MLVGVLPQTPAEPPSAPTSAPTSVPTSASTSAPTSAPRQAPPCSGVNAIPLGGPVGTSQEAIMAELQGCWRNYVDETESYLVRGMDVMRFKGGFEAKPFRLHWDEPSGRLWWGSTGRYSLQPTWLQMLTWPGTENITYAFAMCAPDALTNSRLLDFNRQLAEEQELFRDLLILPWLEDVYWGWPHAAKTFLALLAALERQPFAQHFAVLHDDVYVHIPRLALLLADHPSGQGLYLGNAYRGHDFVGHRPTDGEEYEEMHGHRKMS
eukprot:g13382.t1